MKVNKEMMKDILARCTQRHWQDSWRNVKTMSRASGRAIEANFPRGDDAI